MSFEWPQVSLEELTDGTTITYGVVKPGEESPDGVRFVRGGDVIAGQIQVAHLRTITKEVSQQYSRTLLRGGELLVSLVGNPGEVALVPPDLEGANIARQVGLVRLDAKKAYPNYVQFFLRSRVGRDLLLAHSKGSVQQVINLADLKSVRVPLPPMQVQVALADFMQYLDDRIPLLRETNATLEAIAQALFKSWFVDFDPVRAKQSGRTPEGMDEATAALFPGSFEESELGLVPKGWRVAQFSDFIERQSVGKKYDQKSAKTMGSVPILDQGKSGIIGFHDDKPGVTASLDEPVVVFANHTCYMRLITFPFSAIQNVLPFKGKGADTVWAYYATQGRVGFSEYKGHWPDFAIEKAPLPDEQLTVKFRETVDPLVRRMKANDEQAENLAELRDTLLPRLISGQLRVPDVSLEEFG